MERTDGELLDRWRGGDAASGEALFDRYYELVDRFFVNKVADAVPDLAQETFARCVAGRDRIRDNAQFRLYLFGIAYNVLKRYLRDTYRYRNVDLDESALQDLDPGPSTLALQHREHRALLEALRGLPIDDQVVIELHYWEGLTTDDIAVAMDLPVGTVRGRMQRARAKLGEVMVQLTASPEALMSTAVQLDDWAHKIRQLIDGEAGRS